MTYYCSIFDNDTSLNDQIDQFYTTIYDIIDRNVEYKRIKKSNPPHWYDKKSLKNLSLKKEFTSHNRDLYNDYKVKMQQMITDDPLEFYKHIN